MATRKDHPKPTVVASQAAAKTGPSLVAKIVRWFGISAQRNAVAEQIPANATRKTRHDAEPVPALDAGSHRSMRGKRQTHIGNHASEHTTPELAEHEGDTAANDEDTKSSVENTLPLIRVETATGGRYYVRREDWMTARAQNATNVPTCDWQGNPIQLGSKEKAMLRRTTIEKSTLVPLNIVTVDSYLIEREIDQSITL